MSSPTTDSTFTFLPQGAILQEFRVHGHNLVQAFPTAALYLEAPYLGETIGRTANRIKNATIDSLNGKSYKLAQNNGPNNLHGGHVGFGKRVFEGPVPEQRHGKEAVKFTYLSPDGEEGYPGTVELRVWYIGWEEHEGQSTKTYLEIEYEAELVGDECEETVVAITNHSYFNFSDAATIEGTEVILHTGLYLPLDDSGIPLGHIASNPSIQPGKSFTLGRSEPKFDDCLVIDPHSSSIPLDTRSRSLQKLASLAHPSTHLHLEVSSTEPAFQFYTGDHVDVPASENSPAKLPRAGLCIEPSRYVNAVNMPEWRDMVVVKRGEKWGARIVYKAWKE